FQLMVTAGQFGQRKLLCDDRLTVHLGGADGAQARQIDWQISRGAIFENESARQGPDRRGGGQAQLDFCWAAIPTDDHWLNTPAPRAAATFLPRVPDFPGLARRDTE